jgi:hypothetical protein
MLHVPTLQLLRYARGGSRELTFIEADFDRNGIFMSHFSISRLSKSRCLNSYFGKIWILNMWITKLLHSVASEDHKSHERNEAVSYMVESSKAWVVNHHQ